MARGGLGGVLPGPPSLPPGRRCWGRTPRPPPGVGAASASPDSTVRPFGGSWSEDAMCRVCLRHYCFARGHAGKGMQARDISRLVPGQGLSVRRWAGYCVALTHRPQPLCQRGSRCLFHKRFSGGPHSGPGGGRHTEATLQAAAAAADTGRLPLQPTPRPVHTALAQFASLGGRLWAPSRHRGRTPFPHTAESSGEKRNRICRQALATDMGSASCGPQGIGACDRGQAVGVAGPQEHPVMLRLPPGIRRGPP